VFARALDPFARRARPLSVMFIRDPVKRKARNHASICTIWPRLMLPKASMVAPCPGTAYMPRGSTFAP
jgi:hypothetical protein